MQQTQRRVKSLYTRVAGQPVHIVLHTQQPIKAVQRLIAAAIRHGWLQGVEPRMLVRDGGVA